MPELVYLVRLEILLLVVARIEVDNTAMLSSVTMALQSMNYTQPALVLQCACRSDESTHVLTAQQELRVC